MGIICQYDRLKNAGYLGDISRKVTVEAKLKLPDEGPRVGSVIGGDFLVESTTLAVDDDFLMFCGKLCPRLIFSEDHPRSHERRRKRSGDSEFSGSDEEGRENDAEEYLPVEYGYTWTGDDGVAFEERVEVPGLRKEMVVQVEVRAGVCGFEKNGSDRVSFRAEMNLTIHVTYNHEADIMSDVVVQGPEKLSVNKEHVSVEEVIELKQAAIPVRSSLMMPGVKPGIARILSHQVRPSAVSCEINRGRVLVKGFLEVSVMYIGSDDAGRPTDVFVNEWGRESGTALPFETFLEGGIPEEQVILTPKVLPRNITLDISSRHELLCKIDLECEVKVSRVVTKEMVVSVTPESKEVVDAQRYLLNFEEYGGEATGEIALDSTLDLPSGQEGLERVLTYRGSCGDVKVEASAGNVLVEGNLDLWLTYVSGTGDMKVVSWNKASDNALPVAGMLELPDLQPSALFNTQLTVESLRIEQVSERSVKVAGVIKVRVFARNPRAVFVIKDCALVAPVDPATRPSMMFYIVQPDDTLWKIARRYQTTVDALAKVNQISNPERIQVGQKLLIPKHIA